MRDNSENQTERDDIITDIHPPGSYSDIRYFEPAPERELVRPVIVWWRVCLNLFLALAVAALTGVGCRFTVLFLAPEDFFLSPMQAGFFSSALILFLTVVVFLKKILIFAVHVYQHFAPDHVRLRCLFTPSCSEYMIMAIEKYGAVRGAIKGIKRLLRCHLPNGGEDYP